MATFGGTADGRAVELVPLRGGGLNAEVLTLGATIRDLRLEGWPHPLVLGLATVADYERVDAFVGAVVGRYANRIAGARFDLDGNTVRLVPNEGPNVLHGGPDGFHRRVWTVREQSDAHVRMTLVSPAGDQGFPGRVDAAVTYRLAGGACLDIVLEAEAFAPTVVNLSQHGYFNLGGGPTIDDHSLQVGADTYLPVDAADLPLAGPAALLGTPFDLAAPRPLADATGPLRIDHCYCLAPARREAPVAVASLRAPGLVMTLATTEPGLQVYTGDKLGRGPVARAGICLEPQIWPDAPNRADFPSALLRPGQRYRHETRLIFARAPS